ADSAREVEPEWAGGHRLDVVARRGIAERHHRALAELLFNLSECGGERLLAVLFHLRIFPSAGAVRKKISRRELSHKRAAIGARSPRCFLATRVHSPSYPVDTTQ